LSQSERHLRNLVDQRPTHGEEVPGGSQGAPKLGWSPVRTTGSHEQWTHPDGRHVTVAGAGKANGDVPAVTLANIRRSTGLEDLR
ncbi:MAG TPA: type II toxin-antitoxin system HicA family toxin, partial [Solirubrobacteraceae bacterium]